MDFATSLASSLSGSDAEPIPNGVVPTATPTESASESTYSEQLTSHFFHSPIIHQDSECRAVVDTICLALAIALSASPISVFLRVWRLRKEEKIQKQINKSRANSDAGIQDHHAEIQHQSEGGAAGESDSQVVIDMPPLPLSTMLFQDWALMVRVGIKLYGITLSKVSFLSPSQLYGIGLSEMVVALPNAIGLLFSTALVILYPRFWNRKACFWQFTIQIGVVVVLGVVALALGMLAMGREEADLVKEENFAGGATGMLAGVAEEAGLASELSSSKVLRSGKPELDSAPTNHVRLPHPKIPNSKLREFQIHDFELHPSSLRLINLIGDAGVFSGCIQRCHPLPVLHKVWRTKNTDYMGSLFMNLVGVITSVFWMLNATVYLKSRPLIVQAACAFTVNVINLGMRFVLRNEERISLKDVENADGANDSVTRQSQSEVGRDTDASSNRIWDHQDSDSSAIGIHGSSAADSDMQFSVLAATSNSNPYALVSSECKEDCQRNVTDSNCSSTSTYNSNCNSNKKSSDRSSDSFENTNLIFENDNVADITGTSNVLTTCLKRVSKDSASRQTSKVSTATASTVDSSQFGGCTHSKICSNSEFTQRLLG